MDDPARDIETQVVHRAGKVMMLFSRRNEKNELTAAQTDHLILDPAKALDAAEILTGMAFEADTGLKPVGATLKASLVDKHRKMLKPIIETVLRTKINAKRPLEEMSVAVLDEMCKEIFP